MTIDVFRHHIYEYQKGLRRLVLHTAPLSDLAEVERMLARLGVAFRIEPLGTTKFNVFFGDAECIAVVEAFGSKSLASYSDEEDFILGTMLGYDLKIQCRRYLERRLRHRAARTA